MIRLIFLVLIFTPSISLAKSKCFVIGNGPNRKIECVRGFTPKNIVAEAPVSKGRYVTDIDIVSIRTIDDGEEAFVSPVKKTEKDSLILDKQNQEINRMERKKARLDQIQADFDNFNSLTQSQRTQLIKKVVRAILVLSNRSQE